jgi:hypothetical protein
VVEFSSSLPRKLLGTTTSGRESEPPRGAFLVDTGLSEMWYFYTMHGSLCVYTVHVVYDFLSFTSNTNDATNGSDSLQLKVQLNSLRIAFIAICFLVPRTSIISITTLVANSFFPHSFSSSYMSFCPVCNFFVTTSKR